MSADTRLLPNGRDLSKKKEEGERKNYFRREKGGAKGDPRKERGTGKNIATRPSRA